MDRVKESLARDIASNSVTAAEKKAKETLKNWLDQQSLVGILDWFDCIEQTRARRDKECLNLKTELTSRDKLFLKLLMAPSEKTSSRQETSADAGGATPTTDVTPPPVENV